MRSGSNESGERAAAAECPRAVQRCARAKACGVASGGALLSRAAVQKSTKAIASIGALFITIARTTLTLFVCFECSLHVPTISLVLVLV